MASIRKRGQSWHAQVRMRGHRPVTQSFRSKVTAAKWAKQVETEIEKGVFLEIRQAQTTSLAEILDRYANEVLPTKRAIASELSRIKRLKGELGGHNLTAVSSVVVTRYRNYRLTEASAQTVRHEMILPRDTGGRRVLPHGRRRRLHAASAGIQH